MSLFYGVIFLAVGVLFATIAAINAEWYFSYLLERKNVRIVPKKHRRTFLRVYTAIGGILLIVFGLLTLFEIIKY